MRPARALPPLLAVAVLLAACTDARREVARAHLQANPPPEFTIVALPSEIPLTEGGPDAAEALVSVRLRLARPTVETFNAVTLPRGEAVDQRLAELRGWALGAFPAEDPAREQFLARVAEGRAGFPVKRVVTPAGTEIDGLAALTLRRSDAVWRVDSLTWDARAPGMPDVDPAVPFADSPGAAERFAAVEAIANDLAAERQRITEERRIRGEQSRRALTERLRTGRTFEGRLADGTDLRLVVTRGLRDGPDAAVVVLTVRGPGQSSARFAGALAATPTGELRWRSTEMAPLSAPSDTPGPRVTSAAARPTLTLVSSGGGLAAEIVIAPEPPQRVELEPAGSVELIPEP